MNTTDTVETTKSEALCRRCGGRGCSGGTTCAVWERPRALAELAHKLGQRGTPALDAGLCTVLSDLAWSALSNDMSVTAARVLDDARRAVACKSEGLAWKALTPAGRKALLAAVAAARAEVR